jgi:sugar O-acyltransferase (sialic acid O-acetyltransferase NeuD family)
VTDLVGVYGAGGAGRGILPLLRQELDGQHVHLVFVDDAAKQQQVNGHDIVDWETFVGLPANTRRMCLAIANSEIREQLARRCHAAGIGLIAARAASVVVMDDVAIGEGACLSPFVTLTSNVRIGRCFYANLYSYVEHDCVIGDFVTFAPGVKCNGNVHIDDHAYVGAGAIIRQGTPENPMRIGKGAVIGMGAVVTKDVAPGTTVVGNPARPLQRA